MECPCRPTAYWVVFLAVQLNVQIHVDASPKTRVRSDIGIENPSRFDPSSDNLVLKGRVRR